MLESMREAPSRCQAPVAINRTPIAIAEATTRGLDLLKTRRDVWMAVRFSGITDNTIDSM